MQTHGDMPCLVLAYKINKNEHSLHNKKYPNIVIPFAKCNTHCFCTAQFINFFIFIQKNFENIAEITIMLKVDLCKKNDI